jgi:GT2 family glycosyltransferase
MGVSFSVKRATIAELGGFDERLGPGVPDLPAADDMDFNYRLLRAGHAAFVTPRVRVTHEQWRTPDEIVALYRGYWRAWAGFAGKHLRQGDRRGGTWLWLTGARDIAGIAWSALRLRSRLRARVAAAMLAGFARGSMIGLRRRW